jgi:hypothetical protein
MSLGCTGLTREQAEAVPECADELLRSECREPSSRQLECQRQPVEAPADLDDK